MDCLAPVDTTIQQGKTLAEAKEQGANLVNRYMSNPTREFSESVLNEADEFERGNADNDNPEATFPHLEDEGLLKSNIAQTWDNKETIKKDLEEFIGMALRAGGPDLVEDIIFKLENATEYAKKSVRTFKTVY